LETCLKDQVRAYPGLRVDVATNVDHVLEGLCVGRRHGQLRVAMGTQQGFPINITRRFDRPGFQGFRGFGVPVDLRRRHTARSAVRSMLRIRNA
jgi:hypothetical protein